MNKPVFTLCLFMSCIFTAIAQTDFSGRVVEENRKPVKDAIVFLLGQKSVIEKTVMTDSLGRFQIREVDFNKEIVRVTAFGYENRDITSVSDTMVVMKPLGVNLQEVEVQAAARVEQKNDRFVFSVANTSLAKASSSSFELLKMTPMIETRNDKINIVGKESAELYINGRKTNLTQEAIRSYLESLPADRIANIEVITNPGVTNSIDANKGIINLVLKKNEADGVKGSLSLEDTQNKLNSQKGGLYLDVQKGNFNMTANVYGENSQFKKDEETNYYYNTQKRDFSINKGKDKYIFGGGNVRMDYKLAENHTVGAIVDFSHRDISSGVDNKTSYFADYAGSLLDSLYTARNDNKEVTNRISTNLNYRAKLSDKDNLTVDFDYFLNKKDHTNFSNFIRQELELLPEQSSAFNERSEETINNYSGKVEYRHNFSGTQNLIAGVEFSQTNQDANFTHNDIIEDVETPDLSKNNYFEYEETLVKAYLSWNWSFGNKWRGNAGVRLENSEVDGKQQVTSEKIDRHDFNIAPNLSVLYLVNDKNALSYNFMTSIVRPGFYSLNPFQFYVSPNTYKAYNPNLENVLLYDMKLDYIFDDRFLFGFKYTYIDNCTNNFYVPVNDRYNKLIKANYGDAHLLGLNFIWDQSFVDNRLYMNVTASGNYNSYRGSFESIVIDTDGFSATLALNSSFVVSPKYNWSVNLGTSYSSPSTMAQEDASGRFRLGLSAKKTFPKNIALNFGVNFSTLHDIREKTYSNYRFHVDNKTDFTGAFVRLVIPFGNTKTKGAQGRNTTSSSSRLKE